MKNMQTFTRVLPLLAVIFAIGLAVNYAGVGKGFADNEQTPAAKPAPAAEVKPAAATFVGSDTCSACHEEATAEMKGQFHATAMSSLEAKGQGHLCEGCHGPGSLHAADPSAVTALPLKKTAIRGEGCLNCHGTRLSPTKWRMSDHLRAGVGCLDCHTTVVLPPPAAPKKGKGKVDPKAQAVAAKTFSHANFNRSPGSDICLSCHGKQRGEISLPSHHPIKEGRVSCSDCHDPHVQSGREIKRDVCITCHLEQRGPFRFEHGAITNKLTDSCLDCHRPHGSPNQRLLKISNRGLCLQCHADKVQHFAGRRCWDCHQAVHGSNSTRRLFEE